jgi:hypothetical protein
MIERCRALAVAAATISVAWGWMGCDSKPHEEPSHALPPLNAAPSQAPTKLEHAVHDPIDPIPSMDPHAGLDPHGGSEPHAQMAQVDPHADAEGLTPGGIAFDKNTVIAGALKLDGKTKDKVKPGDTIFVVVRGMPTSDAPQGQVLAVRRLDAATFPMTFQIDSRDAMIAGTTLKPPVTLNVRVDKDGDAITKNPGDVVGVVTLKTLPVEHLSLTLDQVL